MSLRQRTKRRVAKENYERLSAIIQYKDTYTRIQKIEALQTCGFNISRKTDSGRTEKKLEEFFKIVAQKLLSIYEERLEATRKRRMRKRRNNGKKRIPQKKK